MEDVVLIPDEEENLSQNNSGARYIISKWILQVLH